MQIGQTVSASFVVSARDSAKALALTPDDDFPEVFATSRMIALMEVAAARGMKALLQSGQLSVGVGVDVKHLAATAIGAEVRMEATLVGIEGRLYRFAVRAFDPGGLIGEGWHTRAIVGTDRLVAGAKARSAAQAAQEVK
jgi:predicted thioesterase